MLTKIMPAVRQWSHGRSEEEWGRDRTEIEAETRKVSICYNNLYNLEIVASDGALPVSPALHVLHMEWKPDRLLLCPFCR